MLTIRVSFEKRGEAAYISLLDLQRVCHRILKRSGLPVYYTQGFNPHIYLSFNCPLSLGQESLCESCDIKTEEENPDLAHWQQILQPYMPHGIRIQKVAPAVHKSGEIVAAEYDLILPPEAEAAVAAYTASEQVLVEKKTKRGHRELNLKSFVPALQASPEPDGRLSVPLRLPSASGEGDNLNPALLLGYLEQQGVQPWQCEVVRTRLLTADGEDFY